LRRPRSAALGQLRAPCGVGSQRAERCTERGGVVSGNEHAGRADDVTQTFDLRPDDRDTGVQRLDRDERQALEARGSGEDVECAQDRARVGVRSQQAHAVALGEQLELRALRPLADDDDGGVRAELAYPRGGPAQDVPALLLRQPTDAADEDGVLRHAERRADRRRGARDGPAVADEGGVDVQAAQVPSDRGRDRDDGIGSAQPAFRVAADSLTRSPG